MVTTPPGRSDRPVIAKGSPSPSTSAPRTAKASRMTVIGRAYACSSPSKRTGPSASRASAGRKRSTVPARPQSMVAPPVKETGGITCHWSPLSSTRTPRARNPSRISRVSRASRPLRITEGPSPSAASTRARLVWDLEPGTLTVARTGASADGADQGWSFGTPAILGHRRTGAVSLSGRRG